MASDHKYKRLDSVRGLAAFSVGVGHVVLFLQWHSLVRTVVLSVFDGYYAVDVFFVLSGFVLTHMVREFSGRHYIAYLVRRLLRLYAPLWAALGISWGIEVLVRSGEFQCFGTAWGCHLISAPHSAIGVLKSAIPIDYRLDPVIWTIKVEIGVSIVYPFMLALWRTSSSRARVGLLVITTLLAYLFGPYGESSLGGIPHFLFLFLFGVALTNYRPKGSILGAVVLALFCGFFLRSHFGTADVLRGISAALLISAVAYDCPAWLSFILDRPLVRRLGTISYSYYLLNVIALWTLALTTTLLHLPVFLSAVLLTLGAWAAAFAVSEGLYRLVEHPAISLSRSLEKRLLFWWASSPKKTGRPLSSIP